MRKFILILLVLFLSAGMEVLADETSSSGDLWDNWGMSHDYYGQDKSVSDKDFDKAVEQVKNKKNKWTNRIKKLQQPRGQEYSESNESEALVEKKEDTLPVLALPVELDLGNGSYLPVGHYQIKAEKEDGKVVLKFYQAQYVMATFPAVETEDDFNEEELLFGKWFMEDDDTIRIIYGSMDLNAYTYIKIKHI